MITDTHGYSKLFNILKRVAIELRDAADSVNADNIAMAMEFSTGSPSEFFGEARLALERVLSSNAPLSTETTILILQTIEDIKEGFRRVGDG